MEKLILLLFMLQEEVICLFFVNIKLEPTDVIVNVLKIIGPSNF